LKLNRLIKEGTPCLFYTNFDASKIHTFTLDELEHEDIEFSINEVKVTPQKHSLQSSPLLFQEYQNRFNKVIEEIKSGNTYLLNLTCKTPIQTHLSLKEIFYKAHAKYKLRVRDEFVCFSPECFISIEGNSIKTHPMKGTIDAKVEGAQEKILADAKELAEHTMVVDLLRNDLSIVASQVRVNRFRYVEKIAAGEKELLQVSSEIEAQLPSNWRENFSEILQKLLPAGSITGTPKKSTIAIIKELEGYERGYFTGVFGYFNGENIESGVMIRFIEKQDEKLFYKSGGGITLDSNVESEYAEMLQKIYIP